MGKKSNAIITVLVMLALITVILLAFNRDKIKMFINEENIKDTETDGVSTSHEGITLRNESEETGFETLNMDKFEEQFDLNEPLPDMTIEEYLNLSWDERFYNNRKGFLLQYVLDLKESISLEQPIGHVLMQNNMCSMLEQENKIGDIFLSEDVSYKVTKVYTTTNSDVTDGYIKRAGQNENGELSEDYIFVVCEMEISNTSNKDIPAYAFNRMRYDFFAGTEIWWSETIEYCSFQPGEGTSLYYYNYFPAGEVITCYYAADVPIEAIKKYDLYLLINNSHNYKLDAETDTYIYLSDITITE